MQCSKNGSILKEKNLLPRGSKFFPFRVDPFQKELHVEESNQEIMKVVSIVQNG